MAYDSTNMDKIQDVFNDVNTNWQTEKMMGEDTDGGYPDNTLLTKGAKVKVYLYM